MRQYAKISTSLWVSSQKWKTLSGDNAKLLYFYLHTCTHSTPIGTYVLPLAYASADLSWEDPELERAMVELEEAGLVVYDRGESVVHLPGALLVDPPTNTKHAQGMASAIKRLPVSVCRDLCVAEFLSLSNTEAFQDPLQSLSKGFRKPFDRTGTGKERKGTGTVPEDPPTPLPPNVGGGRDGLLETDKEAKDGTDTTATTMHIGQRVNELWRELGLGTSRGYDWNQGAVRITTLTADFTDEEILEGVRKIARTPGLAWAGKRGPAYLATRNPEGTWRLEIVLTWDDNPAPEPQKGETAAERAKRLVGA